MKEQVDWLKKISDKGQIGGYLVENNMIEKLIPLEKILTNKQKQDILTALQNKTRLFIKPTQKQTGGALGTILASIGIPIAIEVVKKILGKGVPRIEKPPQMKKGGLYYPGIPSPLVGTWKHFFKET